MLTDASITAAIRRVNAGKSASATLADKAPRGAGRLVLVIKPGAAIWYSQKFVDGRRRLQKLATYPATSLAAARAVYGQHTYQAGRFTVGDLFDAYLKTLEGRPSHTQAANVLGHAADHIGRTRLARSVTTADLLGVIRAVYMRGHAPMAYRYRTYLSSAFGWAIKASNDYRVDTPRDWGLTVNPADAIPQDTAACKPGTRWLRPPEFVLLLRWALGGRPGSARLAAAVLLLTGQRIVEITRITRERWDGEVIHWPNTKTGVPHTIPVCTLAAGAMSRCKGPVLFPIDADSVLCAIKRSGLVPDITARDIRRTWKTLAASAGLTKVERDMLQNHGDQGDVAERHYNRYDQLPEKLAAVAKWERWLHQQLGEDRADGDAGHIVRAQDQQGGHQIDAVI